MALALAERPGRMSPEEFLAFYEERPEGERWELYDGVPVEMMTPVSPIHNRIGSNLESLLNDGLAEHDPSRMAYQRLGVELPDTDHYRPEPDVVVVDAKLPEHQRYPTRIYLFAEIVSSSDRDRVPGSREVRIEAKRRIYRQHAVCEAVLTIEQDEVEVLVETRQGDAWMAATLKGADAELRLPAFGRRCRLGDLYANTPLRPRRAGE